MKGSLNKKKRKKSKKMHFFEKKSPKVLQVKKKAIPLHTSNENNNV